MSALLARIMLAMLMLPSAAVLYVIVFVTQSDAKWIRNLGYPLSTQLTWILSGMITWLFVAIYWWLLWRNLVRWTTARMTATVLSVIGACALGLLAYVLLRLTMNYDRGFGTWAGSVVAPISWLIGTTFFWRETAAERAARTAGGSISLACPTCGYNLTGLQGTRCPECGTTFTLTELLEAQAQYGDSL